MNEAVIDGSHQSRMKSPTAWQRTGSHEDDDRSLANLYSLIEAAKANGLEPYAYLRRVFTELPAATTVADIEALLPWA